jgi:hypothetical protein
MPRNRRQNIDRKTNKPELKSTVSTRPDLILNRAEQVRRDDDVVRTPKRTVYDIDYAIKWFLDNEIQPQVQHNNELVKIPIVFANGEKWDNVRRLGYLRDEKGMLQSPIIVLKRNSLSERDTLKKLDVNNPIPGNQIVYKQKYNKRNRYIDELVPIPKNNTIDSKELYTVNIPEYVDVEYEMLIWTDFTTQMNEVIEQIMPYGTFAWGNEFNKYRTFIRDISFETVNTVGDDRLVRATIPLTVNGTLLSEQEFRMSTVQKRYSIKKIQWALVIDVTTDIFSTTKVPQKLIDAKQRIISGNKVIVSNQSSGGGGGGAGTEITPALMNYLTQLIEKQGVIINNNTISVTGTPNYNTIIGGRATTKEFDIYINGQYIDTAVYNWTPNATTTQQITFDTTELGYNLESDDIIIINGRWSE